MPIEYPEENPRDGTGVYYPACSKKALYAYHGISGRVDPKDYQSKIIYQPQELVATEKAFRRIWKQGAVYSSVKRKELGITDQSSMFQGMDRAAGDDEYVFLNICKPHSAGHHGYHLVFNPVDLVDAGALVGLDDLQGIYMTIADRLRIKDRNDDESWTKEEFDAFRSEAELAQRVWRMRGNEAIDWLGWVQGVRQKCPVNKSALRYIDRILGAHLKNIIRWLASSPESAIGYAEILMPDELPLDLLEGVIFRKNWIEIDDFIEFYGPPGSEPPPALDLWEAQWVTDRTGHPICCPRCGDWMSFEPLETPKGSSSYHYPRVYEDRMRIPGEKEVIRVMRCGKCGAAFSTGGVSAGSFDEEEYVGQYEDLEYVPYSW